MTERIALSIAGRDYLDYLSAEVRYSIEELARSFTFTFSDKWLNTDLADIPFAPGDEAVVRIYGQTAVEGFVETVDMEYAKDSRRITVSGRSRAGDLIDCSARHKTGSWRNVTLATIGKALLQPYGLQMGVDPWAVAEAAYPFRRWAIEDEETVHGCIGRAAKMRGLFLVSDAAGNVFASKASPLEFPYALSQGQNVTRARYSIDHRQRYSEYTVKSQSAGDDTLFGENVARGHYTTTDPEVTRTRPLIVVSDGQGRPPELETRGNWERNYRAGKSRRVTYVHPQFLTPHGLFPINRLVTVQDPIFDLKEKLLIASVVYRLDHQETTQLELAAPESFDVQIKPRKRPRKKSSGPLW